MILRSIGPFDYKLSTKVITYYFPQLFDYMDNNKYRRVFRVNDHLKLVEAKFLCGNKETRIAVNYLNSECDVDDIIIQKIKWILSLDVDLSPFYFLMEKHPIMNVIKGKLFGLKLLRSASPYEAIIEAIIEQQISKKASITLRNRLATNYSDFVIHKGMRYYEFPKPEVLVLSNHDDLRGLGLTDNKISAIRAISELECQGQLEDLLRKPLVEIYSELNKIRGIGKWTIQYSLIRGLGRHDIPLENDMALRSGIDSLFGKNYFAAEKDWSDFLKQYNEYVGYVSFYIIYMNVFYREAPHLLVQ
jgi:DNA-3-methyladenine glycosylase II